MDLLNAIKERRSVRKYTSRAIDDDKLNKVLEAARLSPSARNLQSWKFIVVKDNDIRLKIAEASGKQMFISQAPVIIVACGTDPQGVMACGQPRHTVDLSIATAYMMLEAQALGLGTCWISHFDEKRVKEILEIPEEVRVVALTPLGYPAESPAAKSRKSLEDIVCYEKYE